jgi:hypothetical protein
MFWTKIVYSVAVCMFIALCLWLASRTRGELRVVTLLFGAALASVPVMNILAKLTHFTWLETFSRDTLEFVVSPLPVLFLIPVLVLYRKTAK